MKYLIDSDWVIDYLTGRRPAGELVAALAPYGIAITAITFMEVLEGVRGGREPQSGLAAFHRFLDAVHMFNIDSTVADRAADIRLHLRQQKQSINNRALDILIAATAIEHNLILVTRNLRHYADIPGLHLHAG